MHRWMPVFLIILELITDTTKRNSNDWFKRKVNHLVARSQLNRNREYSE